MTESMDWMLSMLPDALSLRCSIDGLHQLCAPM